MTLIVCVLFTNRLLNPLLTKWIFPLRFFLFSFPNLFIVQLGQFFSGIPLLHDAIYRNGGDEFIAIIDGDKTEANIRNLASFIHRRFAQPWRLKRGEVFCNVSIGVARYPEDGRTAEELLLKADQAMYKVKKAGGKGVLFGYEL